METARPRDLGFLKDFAGLDVAKLLEVQDKARLAALVERYQYYTTGAISEVGFQDDAVRHVMKDPSEISALEIATGGGKTVIAARIAKEHVQSGGKAVYVCPNAAALGSEISGIIQIFHRVFGHYKVPTRIGQVNVPSKVNDVNFFTPMGLLGLQKTSPALFDQLLKLSTVILLDEAHHFTDEDDGSLKIFGKVPQIAKERFHKLGKKVAAFTATYGRLDGKTVVGKGPGFKFTVKNSVDQGRAPEVHGMQIYLPFECPNASTVGSDYDLKLDGNDYVSYWRLIAGYMVQVWKKRPAPLAAFVRLRVEAAYLVKLFNRASGLGKKGLAVLTGDMSVGERERIINAVKDGELIGYVTCGVGVESIDIPKLEVIHLIQRTRSINKVVQAVGRALRPWKGKERALIVDYQVMKESIINGCNGILLYAQGAGIDPAQVRGRANGSALVAIDGAPSTIMPDQATFGQCEEWVTRHFKREEGHKGRLLRLAETKAVRPKDNSKGEFEGVSLRVLALAFYRIRNEKAKEYDPDFLEKLKKIPGLHQSWLVIRGDGMQDRKEELLRKAAAGEPKPSWTGPDDKLAFSLAYWTKKTDPRYDPVFTEKLRKIRPDWLERANVSKFEKPERETFSFQLPDPPPVPELPKDHWFKTGLFIDKTYDRSVKEEAQEAALRMARAGVTPPSYQNDDDPACYFIEKWGEASVDWIKNWLRMGILKNSHLPTFGADAGVKIPKKGQIKMPTVWLFSSLEEDIYQFTTRGSHGGFGVRRYDDDFSWEIKLINPALKCLNSAFHERDAALTYMVAGDRYVRGSKPFYGLTRFERWLKKKQKDFLSAMDNLSYEELIPELEYFYEVDGEFPYHLVGYEDRYRSLPREKFIRIGDAEYTARSERHQQQPFSAIEHSINDIYEGLMSALRSKRISAQQWTDIDGALQGILCGEKIRIPIELASYKRLISEISNVRSILKRHRRGRFLMSYTFDGARKRVLDRSEALMLLWLAKTDKSIHTIVEAIEPGANENPKLLISSVERDLASHNKSVEQNLATEEIVASALSGAPYPEGLWERIKDFPDMNSFELFLYDERIDWLRELDRERIEHAGLAFQTAT